MINTKFGFSLKKRREEKNMTLEDLARTLGVSAQFIYRVESGKAGFPPALIRKWSMSLGWDPHMMVAEIMACTANRIYQKAGLMQSFEILPAGTTKKLLEAQCRA